MVCTQFLISVIILHLLSQKKDTVVQHLWQHQVQTVLDLAEIKLRVWLPTGKWEAWWPHD